MIGKAGEVGLGRMATWLGGLFVSSAGQQEQRQKHKIEAGKRERRQTKEKHKARNKKQSAFTQTSRVRFKKGRLHTSALPESLTQWPLFSIFYAMSCLPDLKCL